MPLLTCPNDGAPMTEVNRNGVQLDICPECRGVWLDRGELEKLLGGAREVEADWDRERGAYRPDASREHRPEPPRDRYEGRDRDDDRYDRYGKPRKKRLSDLFDIFD